jgi:hypothetical protein
VKRCNNQFPVFEKNLGLALEKTIDEGANYFDGQLTLKVIKLYWERVNGSITVAAEGEGTVQLTS